MENVQKENLFAVYNVKKKLARENVVFLKMSVKILMRTE